MVILGQINRRQNMKNLLVFALAAGVVFAGLGDDLSLEGGVHDLQGGSLTVGALTSADAGSRIVNSGARATLTIGEGGAECDFAGSIGANIDLVKTGSGAARLKLGGLGSDALVKVEGGRLSIEKPRNARARWVRFTVLGVNPWRTQNNNGMAQMGYFGLCRGTEELAYPEGTTATDSFGNDAAKVLTHVLGDQGEDWQGASYPAQITIDMKGEVEFNGYRIAGATVSTGRSPYWFKVEAGTDDGAGGIEWHEFDEQKTFCTCGYGGDYELSGTRAGQGYAPRMEPVYEMNPVPLFGEGARVEVCAGATLELGDMRERLPNLSGAGRVECAGARVRLTRACGFAGKFAGFGELRLGMENEGIGFGFETLGFAAVNEGKRRGMRVEGAEGTAGVLPRVVDSEEAPLDLELVGEVVAGKAVERVDRFGNAVVRKRWGKDRMDGARIAYATAPAFGRHLRYTPLAKTVLPNVTGEIELELGGVKQAFGLEWAWGDWYKTTNYIYGSLSDQNAASKEGYMNLGNLFDGNPDAYMQCNKTSASGETEDNIAFCYTLDRMVGFDGVRTWMPSKTVEPNGQHILVNWVLETSVDGNEWERVVPHGDNTAKMGPYPHNRGDYGAVEVEGSAGSAYGYGAGETAFAGVYDLSRGVTGVRLIATEIGGNTEETFGGGTFFDLGEIELHHNGAKVEWAEGTTARFNDAGRSAADGAIDATQQLPHVQNDPNGNGGKQNQEFGGTKAQHNFTAAEVAEGAGIEIASPRRIEFSSYRLFCGDNWNGVYRHLTKWTLEATLDGEAWHEVDRAERGVNFTPVSRWVAMQWYCTREVDFGGLYGAYDPKREELGNAVLEDGATINLTNAAIRAGSLTGKGTILAGGYRTVVELKDPEAGGIFSGTVAGERGVIVVDGGTFRVSKADLRGVEKIVLKNGASLTGTARYKAEMAVEVGEGCENGLRPAAPGMTVVIR